MEVLLGRLNSARNAQGQQEEKIAKKKAEKAEKALNPEPPKEEPSAGESLDDLVVECSTCSVQFAWTQLAEGHKGASDCTAGNSSGKPATRLADFPRFSAVT